MVTGGAVVGGSSGTVSKIGDAAEKESKEEDDESK